MDRPIRPIDHQQRTLDFLLDRLGLREAHARVVEEERMLALDRANAADAEARVPRAGARDPGAEGRAQEQAGQPTVAARGTEGPTRAAGAPSRADAAVEHDGGRAEERHPSAPGRAGVDRDGRSGGLVPVRDGHAI